MTKALDRHLGFQVRQTSAQMAAGYACGLADLEMRPAEGTTLLVIADHPDCAQGEVGEALAIERANLVPIIARLIECALVAQTRICGRNLAPSATGAGAAQAPEAWRRIAAHAARFKAMLPAGGLKIVPCALPLLRRDQTVEPALAKRILCKSAVITVKRRRGAGTCEPGRTANIHVSLGCAPIRHMTRASCQPKPLVALRKRIVKIGQCVVYSDLATGTP